MYTATVAFPNAFELKGDYWTACEDYSWSLGVFQGVSADKTGAFTTGYTQSLNYKTYVVADSVFRGDVTLTIASEFNKIVSTTDSTVVVDENGYVADINKNTTVDDFRSNASE